jgi:hypothetical protein
MINITNELWPMLVTWQFQSKPAPTRTCDPTLACIESIGNLVMTNDSFWDEPAPFAYVVKWTGKAMLQNKNLFHIHVYIIKKHRKWDSSLICKVW